ncbi:unnamed protein product [Malassezia sympodialis ATCC 42132]|uniref:uncharacterized protein n=1 Tax=Malassezia sympodialis (strain ATCC 42132) TaxID=1230383 RepID=UPI0002C23173|nr:uncharacterized protein MSY001_1268 [Malassezia sympodialis ATCC 42132]CCU98562.1 unnamed protein product [Malassezia sympodialis ATCC 42132]|eukprot:XP_018739862.1 uncharacterized protein MSY001_1268 [Malassezia sympodialis ATCC 42132]
MSYYFCIVGTRDNLLYESELSLPGTTAASSSGAGPSASAGGAGSSESHRTSSVFGFTSALGHWSGGFRMPLRQASETKEEAGLATPSAVHERHILQMIAHGSLDMLEDRQFLDNDMCVLCADTDVKLILLHQHKHDEGIRLFLMDAWELWLKVSLSMLIQSMMNPFQDLDAPIRSRSFDVRLRASARKHL